MHLLIWTVPPAHQRVSETAAYDGLGGIIRRLAVGCAVVLVGRIAQARTMWPGELLLCFGGEFVQEAASLFAGGF